MQSKSLFDIPVRATKQNDLALAKKSNATVKKATATVKSGGSILTLISNARALTEKSLGKFRDDYLVIRDINAFSEYIDNAIEFGEIAIDTETTGLDPMLNEVVGLCLYSPNQKPCYVPLNHKSYITHERVDNQIPIEQCREVLERLNVAKTKIIMFNAPFDLRVIKNQIGVDLVCYWDCYLAARLMNENEPENKLKPLHQKYVLKGESDEFTFADLFKGITFDLVPIDTAYLYGAHDGIVTYEFYDFQRKYLRLDNEREDLRDIAWVFFNVEMPCVKAVADMEDIGVDFDFEYNDKLKEKYHALLEEKTQHVYELCEEYDEDIRAYRNKVGGIKLDNPINISSTKQLGVLLYDIIGLPQPIDKKTKKATRGTGEDILKGLKHPICDAILEYRTLEKLVSTYIDKLPECVNPNDHRIHGKFNQYGADTGRFSSSDPNLQNIPSHNKDIRKMFKATDGYVLMSSDFSQQEPKCLAALCRKQGDPQMYNTFMKGKDLYSEIASVSFHRSYEDCLEFYLDENGNKTDKTNKEGKEYRSQAKSILLGVLYGRGTPSVAEQLGTTVEEAQAIKDSVFTGFPAIKQFEEDSLRMAEEKGYVTTVCGRKRRLPDLQLPDYEFRWKKEVLSEHIDVLDFDSDEGVTDVPDSKINYYWDKLSRTYKKDKRDIIFRQADKEGIEIIDNRSKIAEATRQCVNARIQGSAADLTKVAMIGLHQSERLKELGFRMLIQVHDEIIAECPEENAEECAKLLAETMSKSAEKILEMPIKCDVELSKCWYGESLTGEEIKPKETNTSHGIDVEKLRSS